MIRTEISINEYVTISLLVEITKWMEATFGKKEKNKRRVWAVKASIVPRKIIIMTRTPEQTVIVRLRWA